MSYEDFNTETPTDSLERLTNLAAELNDAEDQAMLIEEELKAAKERVRELSEREIPELMADVGMETFVTKEGLKISVREKIHASIPKTRIEEAVAWLERNGHGGMIKSEVTAAFGREDRDLAQELLERIRGEGMTAKETATVHPQTLMKLLNDLDAEDVEFPMDVFGAYRRRVAKVTRKA
jgi:hypothetical protein